MRCQAPVENPGANPDENYQATEILDMIKPKNEAKLTKRFITDLKPDNYNSLEKKTAFYELTLFMPIGCMCILVVLGIWMPVSSGETIGFQITMLV
ncbi:unnamed protein product [Oikopleura dioica]|uniref:Uncharacterized protein n=1 Tax=Oikopleura dioica TaxID=34765 RepID=E4YE30_OIKDI|nr:unnamed protein product [Oikopleura dioica]